MIVVLSTPVQPPRQPWVTQMRKKIKATAAHAEGSEAARVGQGRSTNPYPYSALKDRYEWFKGYDETIDKSKRDE